MRQQWVMIGWMCVAGAVVASADEGMWPLNQVPMQALQSQYGFQPDAAWLEHVQKSCVRVSSGGSGSFVSGDGLIMTNHHVGSDALADLSTAERDLLQTGFLAADRSAELRCAHLKMYQLMSIEDVTAQVNAGVTPDMAPSAAQAARDQAIADLEKAAGAASGWQPETVKLYQGARYHLYQYRVYDDVRLVMAPESGIGFFGGDIDNFEYPRYNLDVCFFRAYHDGQPARTPQHFKWSAAGPQGDEVLFIAGHPARTRRLYTTRHLEFLRDVELPLTLSIYNQREVALNQFRMQSAENARVGTDPLLGVQNGRKAFEGILAGLLEPRILDAKRAHEAALRAFVDGDDGHRARLGSAWTDLAGALDAADSYYPAYYLLENRRSSFGSLYGMARAITRAGAERERPNGERLTEYRDSQLQRLEGRVLSPAPIHMALEEVQLADGLARLARHLGGADPVVRAALGGFSPRDRAARVLAGTRLNDLDYRKSLWAGGRSAVEASSDPLLMLVRAIDPAARAVRQRYENEFESVSTAAYAKIAQATFERFGEQLYPDATYSLRLSIGTVKGYEQRGATVAPMTTMAGAFAHAEAHGHTPPFKLPESWMTAREAIAGDTPFNFVTTHDIIGGNSGSPVFNRGGEIVGLVFDGNIQSLVWDVQFDDRQSRSVSVHSSAIIEALRKVYKADTLVNEILAR